MRAAKTWFHGRHKIGISCFREERNPKNVEPGGATGGGGWRVRAHVLDSESGGAKGHYPKSKTREWPAGSAGSEKFRVPRKDLSATLVSGETGRGAAGCPM